MSANSFPAGTTGHPQVSLSVIIPLWRDHPGLGDLLVRILASPQVSEVMVCCAQVDEQVAAEIVTAGAICIHASRPGRGAQLDLGASQARAEWLLFHHVDTDLSSGHLEALASLAAQPEARGGAFYRKFDERHPALRFLEPVERWHNRTFGALYGDQSIFVRRTVFEALGGFRGLPLMEDVDFSSRLRLGGGVVMLDPPIASSPRKHLAQGPWRTTLTNALLLLLYRLGVSPHRLHAFYYGISASGTPSHPYSP